MIGGYIFIINGFILMIDGYALFFWTKNMDSFGSVECMDNT